MSTCANFELHASQFTGKERDAESGLDYFGARYYGSNMGRWLSPDWSVKASPVPYATMSDPQSLNLYSYVGNNPLSKADADGHCGQQASGPTSCSQVTVTATPATQPAPPHTDSSVPGHTETGPIEHLHMTVAVNGTPAPGVKVTEQNTSTTTALVDGKQLSNTQTPIPGTATSSASGGYTDTVGPGFPPGVMAPADAIAAYNSVPLTSTDTQTQTLTFPNGCTCTATSTRTVTNTADGKTISPGGYTLTTTQPVVSTPKPPPPPQQ